MEEGKTQCGRIMGLRLSKIGFIRVMSDPHNTATRCGSDLAYWQAVPWNAKLIVASDMSDMSDMLYCTPLLL